MAEIPSPIPPIAIELLQDFWAWWARRSQKIAAKDAASLTFWRDGMVRHLKAIGQGTATKKTFIELKKEFEATKQPVQEAISRLVNVRRKLAESGAHALAEQVDIILNDKQLGKNSIRYNIEFILQHRNDEDIEHRALNVCNQIDALNAAIQRLQRLASSQ